MDSPLDPERDTPSDYRKQIRRFGGDHPFGGPMWRVVRAENCLVKRNGTVAHVEVGDSKDEGHWDKFQGKDVFVAPTEMTARPTGWTSGVQWLPKYPGDQGWILEKWFPASMWGSPHEWHAARTSDGLEPMMCDYPSRGDYDNPCPMSWDTLPPLSEIEMLIQQWVQLEQARPMDFAKALKAQLQAAEDKKEAKRRAYYQQLSDYRRLEILPVLKSTSLAAQAVRNEIQKRAGSASHLGANEIYE